MSSADNSSSTFAHDILIIGAGLSGLSCAHYLTKENCNVKVLEAEDKPGGRVQTDLVEGYQLDRGFQVLLTAYPETRELLNYPPLQLRKFQPGALVRSGGNWHRLVDPWRQPQHFFSTLFSSIGSVKDRMVVHNLRNRLIRKSLDSIYESTETSTEEYLQKLGFSEGMINQFFRPFLGGIFLENELQTSSRMFEFVFKMFSLGDTCVPAKGMQAIAQQLADRLPENTISYQQKVQSIEPHTVRLMNGETLTAKIIIVATSSQAASSLLSNFSDIPLSFPKMKQTACYYFVAEKAPLNEPILLLNGEGKGFINNVNIMSNVAEEYAPEGKTLLSVSVVGSEVPEEQTIQQELSKWFGEEANSWRHLKTYVIESSLPEQQTLKVQTSPKCHHDFLYVCGDYLETASINGAIASGRRLAETILSKK
ncbi:Flavin containing amine oxidoreductase [Planctomycetales bacterium 10988]|nr:Flavin containing amine oxidoreductase [Planctomycetales bacterium 10988]